MQSLIKSLIPHAPQMGLYVAPQIPAGLLMNARSDFAKGISENEILALYDSTVLGSAKDGAVFTATHFVFQNYALSQVHEVRYADIVEVKRKKPILRGPKVEIGVNRGRALFHVSLDFSGKPEAASFIERFLEAAMLQPSSAEEALSFETTPHGTNLSYVRQELSRLVREEYLAENDFERLMQVLLKAE